MTQPETQSDLPENLRRQFAALERRLWKMETATAVCCAVAGLVIAFLLLFVSDRFWDSPVWFRTVIACLSVGVLAWSVFRWLKLWVFQRRDLRALANLVQRKFRRLGDRLLGIVELSTEERHAPDFSPALYRAAIHQVATEAEQFDFRQAVNPRTAKRFLAATLLLLVFPALLWVSAPAAGWNTFQRWVAPMANIERYTFVTLADLPDKLVVPHGESFIVTGAVQYRSVWKPSGLSARLERQSTIAAAVQRDLFTFRVPAQTQPGSLRIKIGDAQRELAIVPTHRPSLKELAASVELPDYLQYPVAEEAVRSRALTVVEGSRVAFHGKTSRTLADAQMWVDEKTSVPLKINGESFATEFLKRDGIVQCAFNWSDTFGLSNAPPLRLTLQTQKDVPPSPQLPDLGREVAMLHSDVLEIKARAQDDFGVRSLGLSWDVVSSADESQSWAGTEVRKQISSHQEKKVERVFSWSPQAFSIRPDSTVELAGFARDFFPERERVLSPVTRIYVLGNEKHAELVRQKLDSLLARLEEVSRLEEKIMANTLEAQRTEKETQAGERIEGAKNDQLQNNAHLDELAREGMKSLREALKNPIFPQEALRQWSQNLQAMQQLSQQQMKQAAESLASARQNASSRPQDLAQAEKKEQEALEALAEMQGRMNKQLDDLQALTLSQRLRHVGNQEKEIDAELQKVLPETIGMQPKELPEKFKKINANLAAEQGSARTEAQKLDGEISRFFERTQKTNYGTVSVEIKEAKTVDELERLRGMIQENVAMQASLQSVSWSKRFDEWADKLEPTELCSACKNSSGNQKQLDMTRTLITLLRLRQSETNLREQTRLLDERKENDYPKQAAGLSETQQKFTKELGGLRDDNEVSELDEPFGQTHDAMQQVETYLGKPQTDVVTDGAQAKVVDNLSDLINLINEQAKRSRPNPKGEGGAEEMAFLLQMMSQGNNPGQGLATRSGAGNTAGGTTDRTASSANGEASGKGANERRVSRASGASQNFPVEFRETLENYFKAIEKE